MRAPSWGRDSLPRDVRMASGPLGQLVGRCARAVAGQEAAISAISAKASQVVLDMVLQRHSRTAMLTPRPSPRAPYPRSVVTRSRARACRARILSPQSYLALIIDSEEDRSR